MRTTSPRKMASLVLGGLLFSLPVATTTAQNNYNGNGANGFNTSGTGPIGGGILTITSDAANINFSLTTGSTFSGNALVLYIDSVTGGFGSTASFTDTADGGRTALSGFSNTNRTLANFPTGFGADFGITVEPGNFSGTFNLSNTSNFQFLQGNNLSGSGTGPFTFSVSRTNLGLPASGETFQFVGSLISTSAFRSNETFGPSSSDNVDGFGNPGFTGTTTFSAANTFPVPEPGTVALFSVGAALLAGLGWRRRHAAARQG